MKTYLNELLSARTAAILIVLLAVFAATGGAQTALQGQLAVRALSNDDIGTYKLPATTERSGGLPTVAVGAATYLDALIDINVPGDQIAGVSWEFTSKPAESKAEF